MTYTRNHMRNSKERTREIRKDSGKGEFKDGNLKINKIIFRVVKFRVENNFSEIINTMDFGFSERGSKKYGLRKLCRNEF